MPGLEILLLTYLMLFSDVETFRGIPWERLWRQFLVDVVSILNLTWTFNKLNVSLVSILFLRIDFSLFVCM